MKKVLARIATLPTQLNLPTNYLMVGVLAANATMWKKVKLRRLKTRLNRVICSINYREIT